MMRQDVTIPELKGSVVVGYVSNGQYSASDIQVQLPDGTIVDLVPERDSKGKSIGLIGLHIRKSEPCVY